MGLRETLQAGVATAFSTVGNLKRTLTLYEQTAGSYNEATGAVTRTTTQHALLAVLTSPKRKDLDDPRVRATDAIALIDPTDLGSVVPQVGQLVQEGSNDYTIVATTGVGPADGGPALLWKLVLRRPGAEAA